jgi:hypothetical protein
MIRVWKILKKKDFLVKNKLIQAIQKKSVVSPWILNIFNNNKNKFNLPKKDINLYKIKVKTLGFRKSTKLKNIYNSLKKKKFKLVEPYIGLLLRLHYNEQPNKEWLRIAVPLKSMKDSDGIYHLPKLGHALKFFFLETYWSYPDAIFHPHNEFVVKK